MWPDLTSTRELSSVLSVLSAMITPAVLIMASGSLIMTTSSRLIRCIDRIREMSSELEAGPTQGIREERKTVLFRRLDTNIQRARLLQRAMSRLYIGIGFFILTSVAIGVVSLLRINAGWVPLVTGFFGAGLLLSASFSLIVESRLALESTHEEMDHITQTYMKHR